MSSESPQRQPQPGVALGSSSFAGNRARGMGRPFFINNGDHVSGAPPLLALPSAWMSGWAVWASSGPVQQDLNSGTLKILACDPEALETGPGTRGAGGCNPREGGCCGHIRGTNTCHCHHGEGIWHHLHSRCTQPGASPWPSQQCQASSLVCMVCPGQQVVVGRVSLQG